MVFVAGEQSDLGVGATKTLTMPPRTRLVTKDTALHIRVQTTATVGARDVELDVLDSADVLLARVALDNAVAAGQDVTFRVFPGSGDGELPFPVPVGGKIRVGDIGDPVIDANDTVDVRLFYVREAPVEQV